MKYVKSGLPIAAAAALLAGCASTNAPQSSDAPWTPPSPPEYDIDPTWTEIRQRGQGRFEDLAPAEMLKMALANSPDARLYWESARGAQSRRDQARSKYYPSISVQGSVQKQKVFADDPAQESDTWTYGPSAQLSWLLLDVGGRGSAFRQLEEMLVAANYKFNRIIQDITLNVEKAYFGFHSSGLAVEAAESAVSEARASLEAAEQKLASGIAARLDVLQAKTAYDKALYSLENAKGIEYEAKAALASALGLPADAEITVVPPPEEILEFLADGDIGDMIDSAVAGRADVAAARATLRASAEALRAAESELWPSLSASAEARKDWYRFESGPESSSDDYRYTAGLALKWNIFDGFYNRNAARAARAEMETAKATLSSLQLQAGAEVWKSFYAFQTALRKRVYSEAAHESANESYTTAMTGYENGLKSILDVFQAQSALSESRSALIEARKDAHIALSTLAHALGTIGADQ